MKARVLVVDDNAINLKVLTEMVNKLGYDGVGTKSATDAINKLQSEKFSLVLMDCNMPVIDGYEATQTIREMEIIGSINYEGICKHLPVIALTSDVMNGVHEQCINSGMDDYLSKPVDIAVLGKCVSSYIDNNATTIEYPKKNKTLSIDIEILSEYKRITGDQFHDLATSFINEKPQKFSELREAVSSNNADLIVQLSHTLSGSYGFLGANKASLLCKELNLAARSSKLDDGFDLINNIEQAHQAFAVIVKELL